MDFMYIHPYTHEPIEVLPNYESLIWTERYKEPGEFEFKTADIDDVLNRVWTESPSWLGRFVTVRGSKQVMRVETLLIEEDDAGVRFLTMKGRGVESFLEHRPTAGRPHDTSSTGTSRTIGPYTPRDAILFMLYENIVESNTGSGSEGYGDDLLPGVQVVDSTTTDGGASAHVALEGGPKFTNITNLLKESPFGLRTRPRDRKPFTEWTFGSGTTPTRTNRASLENFGFELYNGLDRSLTQTAREPVAFRYQNGDLIKPSYLFSIKDFKSAAYVSTPIGGAAAAALDASAGSGWDRQDLIIYDDTIRSAGGANLGDFLRARGRLEMTNYRQKTWFDAEISPEAPYLYDVHYSLGDRITLEGEYGLRSDMIVTEYIRTEDVNGERGYPTLTPVV